MDANRRLFHRRFRKRLPAPSDHAKILIPFDNQERNAL